MTTACGSGTPLATRARGVDAAVAGAYRPRDGTAGVLHGVVRDHLEEFLALATRHGDGTGMPRFVEQELRRFLGCGVLAHPGR